MCVWDSQWRLTGSQDSLASSISEALVQLPAPPVEVINLVSREFLRGNHVTASPVADHHLPGAEGTADARERNSGSPVEHPKSARPFTCVTRGLHVEPEETTVGESDVTLAGDERRA